MSTQIEGTRVTTPPALSEKGWQLLLNDTMRFRACNEKTGDNLGPYPTAQEAIEGAITRQREIQIEEDERAAIAEEGAGEGETADGSGQSAVGSGQEADDDDPGGPALPVDNEDSDLDLVEGEQMLPVDLIRTDGGTQPRALFDDQIVNEYKEAMLAGAKFPAIDVFFDGKYVWLADGFYRTEATERQQGESTGPDINILANVHLGTQRDAILFSVAANAAHGQPRTNADKRRAVATLLLDDEWTKLSDSEIARRAKVSQPFVGSLRHELESQNVIAPSSVRKGKDGVTRDTTKIGSRAEAEPVDERQTTLADIPGVTLPEKPVCRKCGCTDDTPCEGGCAWVPGENLCTACLEKPSEPEGETADGSGQSAVGSGQEADDDDPGGPALPVDNVFYLASFKEHMPPAVAGGPQEEFEESSAAELAAQTPRRQVAAEAGEWSRDDVVRTINFHGGTMTRGALEELGCSYEAILNTLHAEAIVQTEIGVYALPGEKQSTVGSGQSAGGEGQSAKSEAASAPATKPKVSIEEILKGRMLMVAFTWIPGVKGKVSVTVNATTDKNKAQRAVIDTDKAPRFPEEILGLITTALGGAPGGHAHAVVKKAAGAVGRKTTKARPVAKKRTTPARKAATKKPVAKKKAAKKRKR